MNCSNILDGAKWFPIHKIPKTKTEDLLQKQCSSVHILVQFTETLPGSVSRLRSSSWWLPKIELETCCLSWNRTQNDGKPPSDNFLYQWPCYFIKPWIIPDSDAARASVCVTQLFHLHSPETGTDSNTQPSHWWLFRFGLAPETASCILLSCVL